MSLSSLYLDAFVEVAKQKNFSAAAKKLHITQSALSQRILNLEKELGTTLFIRESSGVQLTEIGQKLLRYCRAKDLLESEFNKNLKSENENGHAGALRVGGFSTITQSILMPVISQILKKNPDVQVELLCREISDLPKLLQCGQVDFIFSTQPLNKQGIENHLLGYEENVLIRPKVQNHVRNVFLDHDENDTPTLSFWQNQKSKPPIYRRNYLDNINLILEGVQNGMGCAVAPLHLVKNLPEIEIVKSHKPLHTPVYLIYYTQDYYTGLQKECIKQFLAAVPRCLRMDPADSSRDDNRGHSTLKS